jgi:hypothetical protein
MTRLNIVFAPCVALAGCFEDDAEAAFHTCREIEQTILLRQFALSAEKKHLLEICLTGAWRLKPEYCRGVYMNEHEALRDCMEDKGYSFSTMNSLADHFDVTCYRPTWLVKIESVVRTRVNLITAPGDGRCRFWE